MTIEAKEVEGRAKVFSETCRHYGVEATHQRTEIYRELVRTDEHPDVETIYARVRKRIPAISVDTISLYSLFLGILHGRPSQIKGSGYVLERKT